MAGQAGSLFLIPVVDTDSAGALQNTLTCSRGHVTHWRLGELHRGSLLPEQGMDRTFWGISQLSLFRHVGNFNWLLPGFLVAAVGLCMSAYTAL